ncbi:uncharacterized protein LOC101861581 [Aplysia californica]|uniref:Uncharacterized protein LOC101861581 n=1 Tax=Aplysia californica TaxID=6500 RepID=A0ABM0JMU5_APLCA|nr:uncharacterized protein LOC101861581 [Aplysia californica]XP_005097384.1 uncharacterized protein LOC101861581 [Aplysia californica]XP_035825416.1 uncharacterized protein LOC101861581 [Aplysia californica]
MARREKFAMFINATTNATQQDGTGQGLDPFLEPDGTEGDVDSKTMIICGAVGVLVMVIVMCVLLCYRELSRRREEFEFMDELARKDFIKKNVQSKLEQLKRCEDSRSFLEQMELKVPYVTFGGVTKISPVPSFDSLVHRTGSHLHLPHHHNYQPLTSAEELEEDSNRNNSKNKYRRNSDTTAGINILTGNNGGGGSGSGDGRANQRRLFHGNGHRPHVIGGSGRSWLGLVRGFFRRQSSSSEESESGGEECDNGIWIEAITEMEK